jgi:hypothetical protein
VNVRLEHIRDEIINNLTMKKVVCPIAVQNVGTFREYQNYQISTQGLLAFLKGEIMKATNLLVLVKMMWQVRLI